MTSIPSLIERLNAIAGAYPEDVFPPLTAEERDLTTNIGLIARLAAEHGRRLGVVAKEAASALASQQATIAELEDMVRCLCSGHKDDCCCVYCKRVFSTALAKVEEGR